MGATSIATPVDDDGQFNVLAGSMLLQGGTGGATWSGGYTTADGATSTFSSPHTLTSTAVITGAGHTIVSSSVTVPSGGTFTPTTLTHNGGTLSLAGGSPTLAPVTYNLSGGVLSGNRPLQPSAAMNVTGGTLTGNFTTTINGSATFSKTSGGQLTVQNGADLVLNADAVSGGSVCLQDAGGGDPSLVINRQLQITAAADQTVFSCNGALNAPAILIGGPDGHLLRTGAGSNNVVTPLRVAGGTLSVAGGQTFNVVGGFEQTGGLTEIAAGGSFSGGIVAAISGGTFRVDGSYTGTPTFTGTGVLSGAGTVAGTVTNTSGTVRPGSSPGTLTVTGNFNQGPNGTLEVDIEGTTAGNGFDVLAVTGQANLNGTLKAVHGGGFDPALNDVFAFMTSGSRAGAFATLDAPTFLDGRAYLLDYPGSPGFGARLTLRPPSPPDNIKPPTITGTAVAGQPLTCNPGTWTANPALSIEWLRDNQPIAGATQSTYLLTGADAAHQVACRVTASNSSGDAQATSSAVNVSAAAPQNAAAPAITGTPAAGATLTCAGGTWTGVPTPAITYRWLRDGNPIAGAEQATYPVGAADVTSSLTCRVTATNSGGSASATPRQSSWRRWCLRTSRRRRSRAAHHRARRWRAHPARGRAFPARRCGCSGCATAASWPARPRPPTGSPRPTPGDRSAAASRPRTRAGRWRPPARVSGGQAPQARRAGARREVQGQGRDRDRAAVRQTVHPQSQVPAPAAAARWRADPLGEGDRARQAREDAQDQGAPPGDGQPAWPLQGAPHGARHGHDHQQAQDRRAAPLPHLHPQEEGEEAGQAFCGPRAIRRHESRRARSVGFRAPWTTQPSPRGTTR